MLRRRKVQSLSVRGGFEHFQRVRLKDLKAKPELNGAEGVLIQWSEDDARWLVRLDDGTGKEIKPANLELTPEGRAVSADVREGFISEPSHEPVASSQAVGLTHGPTHHRPSTEALAEPLVVKPLAQQTIHKSQGVSPAVELTRVAKLEEVQPDKLEIAVALGARIRVHNLKGAVHLNGKDGVVIDKDFSDDESRWLVSLDEGFNKSIREANLLALAAASASQAVARVESSEFAVGCQVRVIGVQARPELNKQVGVIDGWDDVDSRWRVCLESGPQLLLRRVNLQPVAVDVAPEPSSGHTIVPGARVRVCFLHTATSLNGEEGTALLWNGDEQRWRVRLDDGSGKMLHASNLLLLSTPPPDSLPVQDVPDEQDTNLATGVRVKVQGLQTREDLNDLEGDIVGWDELEHRWQVQLVDGTRIMLKCGNVVPVDGNRSQCAIS